MTLKLFLSYSRHDAEQAGRISQALHAHGHACWLDTSEVPGGDAWLDAIQRGIDGADRLLILLTPAAIAHSRYMQREFLYAERRGKPITPLHLHDPDLPFWLTDRQGIPLTPDFDAGVSRLLHELAALGPGPVVPPPAEQRAEELAYLHRLELQELLHIDLYTPMAGEAQCRPQTKAPLGAVVMRPEFELLRCRRADQAQPPPERFEDVVAAFPEIRRAVLLGEPGAGKTTTLWALARRLIDQASADPQAPIPILVHLGRWSDAEQGLEAFIASQLSALGHYLPRLLTERRVLLLLDALNEIPVGQQAAKVAALREWLDEHTEHPLLCSCRQNDYTPLDLALDRITIRPLDPERVHSFIARYLTDYGADAEAPERLFWQLAGGAAVRGVWETWRKAGADLRIFFSAGEIPRKQPNVWGSTGGDEDRIWQEQVNRPHNLVHLAANPYMLYMLILTWLQLGELPANRAALLADFIDVLLVREGLAQRTAQGELSCGAEVASLLTALGKLAWALQDAALQADEEGARVTLPHQAVARWLTPSQLRLAVAASLLEPGEQVRFTHQLLQEYFTALGLRDELTAGTLCKTPPWDTERWWARSGWEEATIFMAGLDPDNPLPWLDWLADAHPGLLLDCLDRSGCRWPTEAEVMTLGLSERWRPRLDPISPKWETAPQARNPIAIALGRFGLDTRPGVGLRPDGVPDIDWVAIPAGQFLYGEEKRLMSCESFAIARYPVTNAQFHAFIDAGGYAEERWWQGLDEHPESPAEARWSEPNRPRERVSWYEAVAFCRWLSAQLSCEVRLPTEQEWERTARGEDGREYPWGDGYRPGFANIDETEGGTGPHYLEQTSVVGLYPQGASTEGVMDLSGNLDEWCLNEYYQPERSDLAGTQSRVLRGGSWGGFAEDARAAFRYWDGPVNRVDLIGFRVLCVSPIHSDH